MKRKITTGIMVLILATMLVACKKENETPIDENVVTEEDTSSVSENVTDETTSQPEDVVEDTETEEEPLAIIPANLAGKNSLDDAMFDFYASADWQKAYKKFLDEKTNKGPFDEALYSMEYYCLDDIDKDGTPEFMYFYGTCEADYQLDVYTYDGKEMVMVGNIPAGHSQLYSYPNENGLIQYFAHMGYASAYAYHLEDGKLISNDNTIFEEDINEKLMIDWEADYTPLWEVLPGVQAICYMRLSYSYGLLEYGGVKAIDWGITDSEFKKMTDDIILRNKELYAVSSAEFYSSEGVFENGTRTVDEILEDPKIVGNTNGERVVKDIFYGDFNHDGQTECLAVLEESEELTRAFLILSYQNGNVFGYISRKLYNTDYEVYNDEVYEITSYGIYKDEFSFCLDQCKEESFAVDKVDLSAQAKEGLRAYRQDLRGGDDGYLGVMFLGCSGIYSETSINELFNQAKAKYSDEVFMQEINRCKVINQPGEEVYLLIPGSAQFTISIYEQIWGEDTPDGMPKRGELLYQAEQGEMVVVRGNQSDIVSNIEVVVRANGQDLVYNPSLSLEDGRVLTKGRVVDVTRYDDME